MNKKCKRCDKTIVIYPSIIESNTNSPSSITENQQVYKDSWGQLICDDCNILINQKVIERTLNRLNKKWWQFWK